MLEDKHSSSTKYSHWRSVTGRHEVTARYYINDKNRGGKAVRMTQDRWPLSAWGATGYSTTKADLEERLMQRW